MHDNSFIMWTCPSCKIQARVRLFPVHCSCGYIQYQNPPGLGDRVAAALASVGVTERRYNKMRRAVGLQKPCGCKGRQRRLNRVTRKASTNGNKGSA